MNTLKKLQELFKKFPGIGERQAMRFAYFLATADSGYINSLMATISEMRANVKRCARCFALSERLINGVCPVCLDGDTDKTQILIIEKDADRERVIKSKTYKGSYFILGGLAPAIEKDTASYIRVDELMKLISKENSLEEIIIALSATPDGERTTAILKNEIGKQDPDEKIKISVLGRGLSTGTEIEYSDADTLSNALRSRR